MQVHKVSLSNLFSNRRRFVVPLFQRPYVWGRDRQWEPLWADLQDRAEAVLRAAGASRPQDHFLGAIVTVPRAAYNIGVPVAEVIDGQQRLTTLQILLHAMRDVLSGLEQPAFAAAIRPFLRNAEPWGTALDGYKVWPTNVDQAVFTKVVEAGSHEAVCTAFPERRLPRRRKPEPRPRLAEAYLAFYDWIHQFCKDDPARMANALYAAVVEHLQLVHIELETGEDPQAIFEALNGRNEPLLPSDLIKNYLFRKVEDKQQAVYDAHWRAIDEKPATAPTDDEPTFWRCKQRQGRLNRTRLDLFFFHYLTSRTGDEHNIGHLFRDFQKWLDKLDEPVTTTLRDLREMSDRYAELIVPIGDSRLDLFARRVRVLDTSTVYPFVLWCLRAGRERLEAGALDASLVAIESYLVRRAICRLSTKAYNHIFVDLLVHVRDLDVVTPLTIRRFLKELDTEHQWWPDNATLREAWLKRPAYAELGAPRVGMILRAINDDGHSKFHEKIVVQSELTVEHVMPQKWKAKWAPPTVVGLTATEAARARDTQLHTFGNLTLITGTLNSRLSNGTFDERRPHLVKGSLLQLNQWFSEMAGVKAWDEAAMVLRGEALLEAATRIWPGPEGT